jgi:hypothetical protein
MLMSISATRIASDFAMSPHTVVTCRAVKTYFATDDLESLHGQLREVH